MILTCWRWALAGFLVTQASSAELWPHDPSTVERELTSAAANERNEAVQKLSSLPTDLASRMVLRALASGEDEIRIDAARAAAELRLAPAAAIVGRWLVAPSVELRRAALGVLARVPAPELASSIARLLSDGDTDVRVAACSALAFQVRGDAPAALVGRLDDPTVEVRLAAIAALGRLRSRHAVIPLTGVAQADDLRLREASVKALGAIEATEAVPALVLALGDAEATVRAAAVTALGEVGAEGIEPALMALLAREQTPSVRVVVVDELARHQAPDAVQAIVDQLRRSEGTRWERERMARALRVAGDVATRSLEACVREAPLDGALRCAEALLDVGDSAARETLEQAIAAGNLGSAVGVSLLGKLGDGAALPFVLERLDDVDDDVRRAALGAVVELVDPASSDGRAVVPLRGALVGARSIEERALAARALGRTGSAAVSADLLPLVAADVPRSLRLAAVEALATVQSEQRDQVLIGLLADPDGAVRWAAALSLRRGFLPSAAARLIWLYEGRAPVERDLVALALGGVRSPGAAGSEHKRILELVNAERGARRDSLLEAAVWGGPSASSVEASALLDAVGPEERAKVAELCEWLPGSRARLTHLALKDPSLRVRANAAWALGAVGRPEDATWLLRLAAVQQGVAGGNAVAAAGRLAERHGLDVSRTLCGILSSPSPLARLNALVALARTKGRCSDEIEYAALRQDPSHYVRRAAAVMMNGSGGDAVPSRRDALLECARLETHGSVAAACVAAPSNAARRGPEEVLVFVAGSGGAAPTAEAPFAVELPSGYVRVGIADRRGAVLLRAGEAGTVRLLPPDTLTWPATNVGLPQRSP